MTPPPANKKKEIGIPDRHDDRNSTLGRGLRGQQAGELKRQTQSVDAQEGRFRIFTGVRGRGILRSSFAGSCTDHPPRAARMASEARHAALEGSNMLWCWMDMQRDECPVPATLVLCTLLTDSRPGGVHKTKNRAYSL